MYGHIIVGLFKEKYWYLHKYKCQLCIMNYSYYNGIGKGETYERLKNIVRIK